MKNPEISIIVVVSEDRAIGKDNQLLFKIPEDLKRFKKLTVSHSLIMGRKTFESIGKPLPKRQNIIITRNNLFEAPGCEITRSLEEAILKAQKEKREKIFIIGGGQIYQQALPFTDRLYLTIVEGKYDADTYFPDYSDFKNVVFEQRGENNGYKYKFLELEK